MPDFRILTVGIRLVSSLTGMMFVGSLLAQQDGEEPLATATSTTFGTTVVIPAGLRGSIYSIPEDTTVLPDFAQDPIERLGEIWTNALNIPPRHWRAGFPGLTKRSEWFAIDYTGSFWIENPGRYVFALLSDDGSRLFLDGTPVIDNDCQHPPDLRIAAVQLEGGGHRIRVSYFQGPRDCIALVLAIAGPDHQWKIFDVREFKPPPNPDDWRFSNTSSVAIVATAPAEASLSLEELMRRLPGHEASDESGSKSKAGRGCFAPATRTCGR